MIVIIKSVLKQNLLMFKLRDKLLKERKYSPVVLQQLSPLSI